jgi:hypothetical protein
MLFPRQPNSADHIRAFCARFNEGIRVEYKRNFDENVRCDLPKVVSSFANSHGGVLILGVKAINGVPQEPVQGFESSPREELPLTIENICIKNINPAIFPRITEIASDAPGRKFVLIEVDESAEAPHAIDNSTLVYVRTGNAANPFELADVNSVIELLRRRENPLRTRELLFQRSQTHIFGLNNSAPQVQISLCPVMPKRPLCTVNDCWNFLDNTCYRVDRFFPSITLRRVQGGAASFGKGEYGEVNHYGLVIGRRIILPVRPGENISYFSFKDVFNFVVRIYWCAAKFLEALQFKGDIAIEIRLLQMRGNSLPFFQVDFQDEIEHYVSYDQEISAAHTVPAEYLAASLFDTVPKLLVQLCWSIWQSAQDFPEVGLTEMMKRDLQSMLK